MTTSSLSPSSRHGGLRRRERRGMTLIRTWPFKSNPELERVCCSKLLDHDQGRGLRRRALRRLRDPCYCFRARRGSLARHRPRRELARLRSVRLFRTHAFSPLSLRAPPPCSYYCRGAAARRLREVGFARVDHPAGEDFYASDVRARPFDCLVTNPPYSGDHFARCFARAVASARPFALLCPRFVEEKEWFRALFARAPPRPLCVCPLERRVFEVPSLGDACLDMCRAPTQAPQHRNKP